MEKEDIQERFRKIWHYRYSTKKQQFGVKVADVVSVDLAK